MNTSIFSQENKLKMSTGKSYSWSCTALEREREHARKVTRLYNNSMESEYLKRRELLENLFKNLGEKIIIEPPFRCDYGFNITIGENFFAHFDCVILDSGAVIIGDNCILGPGVHIYTGNNPEDPNERSKGIKFSSPVTIGNNVWIGGRSIINPGITIGNNVQIAPGSIITEDIPDNVMVSGGTAKIIKFDNSEAG